MELASLMAAYKLLPAVPAPAPARGDGKAKQRPQPKIGADGYPKLNARQRRTLRRAEVRAAKAVQDGLQAAGIQVGFFYC